MTHIKCSPPMLYDVTGVCILHVGLQNGYRVYVMLLQCLWGKHKLGDDDELSLYMYHVKHMTCAKCGPPILQRFTRGVHPTWVFYVALRQ